MVRAILEGRKTQTRRAVKPQPNPSFLARGVVGVVPQWPLQDGVRWFMADGCSELVKCPYGAPGDRLWVREKFKETEDVPPWVIYAADSEMRDPDGGRHGHVYQGPWTSPLFMRRDASRLLLEITEARVQRVQEISEEDARAEGVIPEYAERAIDVGHAWTAIPLFRSLWGSINDKRGFGWDVSPWVWVIEFVKITP